MHKSLHQRFRDCIPVCSMMGCNITQVLSGSWEIQTNHHSMFSVLVRFMLDSSLQLQCKEMKINMNHD